MKKFILSLSIAIAISFIANAVFASSYTGLLTSQNGGLINTDKWIVSGSSWTTIAYDIVDNLNGTWTYNYTLNVQKSPGISHFDIETSATFSKDNIVGSVNVNGVNYANTDSKVALGDWGNQGNSSPNIPGILHGIKFDIGGETSYTVTFTSNRIPVLGDFYAKGGNNSAVWNAGFTADDLDINTANHIYVPDTKTAVPEPGTFLAIISTIPAVLMALKRRKE